MAARECTQPVLESRFSERMRVVRQHRQMTQKQLAEACGIGRMPLCKIETGRRRVPLNDAAVIAAALEVPLADMLADDPLILTTQVG